jgi:hypothetical protein
MEIGTQRVWDYAADAYVHRLLSTSEAGKIVDLEADFGQPEGRRSLHAAAGSDKEMHGVFEEKMESIQLEVPARAKPLCRPDPRMQLVHQMSQQLTLQREHFMALIDELNARV